MKKIQVVSLVLGTAALIAVAAVYTASKITERKVCARHDPVDRIPDAPAPEKETPEDEALYAIEEEDQVDEQTVSEPEGSAETEEIVENIPEEPAEPEETIKSTQENVVDFSELTESTPDENIEFGEYVKSTPEVEASEDEQEDAPENEAAYAPEEEQEDAADEGKPAENLEEYIELNPDERRNLNVVKDSFAAEGVRTDISFTDNTMFFDFVMEDVADEETREILKPDLEQFLEDQTETYKGIVSQIEQDTGFNDIKMIVIFMDENGNDIVSGHYNDTGRTM